MSMSVSVVLVRSQPSGFTMSICSVKGSGAAPRETEGHAGTPSGSFGCCSSRRLLRPL